MPISVGQPAPDFVLKDQNQKEIKLSDFAGNKGDQQCQCVAITGLSVSSEVPLAYDMFQ